MSESDGNSVELARWAISFIVPAVAGLVGVGLGGWLSGKHAKVQRRHDFVARQLREFYSPLLGLRSEIKMRSELRVRIQDAANIAWRRLCEEARERGGQDELQRLTDDRFPEFKKIIEYDNLQLKEDLLPMYRQMVTIFRENHWLAEPETRAYFAILFEFVELWNRWLAESVPAEVLESLEHGEEPLHPFYEHLQKTHDQLRSTLAQGEA